MSAVQPPQRADAFPAMKTAVVSTVRNLKPSGDNQQSEDSRDQNKNKLSELERRKRVEAERMDTHVLFGFLFEKPWSSPDRPCKGDQTIQEERDDGPTN